MPSLINSLPGIREGSRLPLSNLEGGGRLTYGSIFYVDSVTGSDSAKSGTTPTEAKATIDAAIGLCTANKGDVIYVLQGHAETVAAAITCDIAGVTIIGLGEGNQRPVITGNGAIDAVNITAAGVTFENIRFAAPLVDAQTAHVNVAGAGCTLRNLNMIGSVATENVVDGITLASGANDCLIEGVYIYNVTVDMVSGIDIEAAVARPEIRYCVLEGAFSTGALIDSATGTLAYIHDNVFKNTKAATSAVTFTTGNTTGVFARNYVSGRHTTIATNLVEGTGMDFFNNYVVEEAALSGLLEPAVDAD